MFVYPYDFISMNAPELRIEASYIRLLHAIPDAPPVDMYIDGKSIAKRLSYRSFTEYLTLTAGVHQLRATLTGSTTPVFSSSLSISPHSIQTLAATGTAQNPSIYIIPEPAGTVAPDKVAVRFVHLAPNAPNVDVISGNGEVLFQNVTYKGITQYLLLPPSTYTFNLEVTGTQQNVLYVPNQRLMGNRFYTLYAVGFAGGIPPLQLLTPLDGNTYITP